MRGENVEISENAAANVPRPAPQNAGAASSQNPGSPGEMLSQEELLLMREQIKPVKIHEIFFVLAIIGVFGYICLVVLKNPVPKGLIRIFGMDDPLYPEQYEKIKARMGKK